MYPVLNYYYCHLSMHYNLLALTLKDHYAFRVSDEMYISPSNLSANNEKQICLIYWH